MQIIESLDNRGSDNQGSTVYVVYYKLSILYKYLCILKISESVKSTMYGPHAYFYNGIPIEALQIGHLCNNI